MASRYLYALKMARRGVLVDAEDEIGEAENKKLAFFQAVKYGQGLTLNRMVARFNGGVEPAAHIDSLPV